MSRPLYFALALLMTGGITYLIRLLPILFVRKRIKNRFFKSFLYYVPYAVLATLAFPDILYCAENPASGLTAAAVCALLAYRGKGLIACMLGGVVAVIATESLFLLF